MTEDIAEGFSHLIVDGDSAETEIKPDGGSQKEPAGGNAVEVPDGEEPFAGGAGEGDDPPTSGLR